MTPPPRITIHTYEPGADPHLDDDLARLAYQTVAGWPDQRPITATLVRSRLRTPGAAPLTMLALHQTDDGQLVGAAALRHPGGGDGSRGRLWGPLVHPGQQQRGIGRALLAALPADVPCTTAEIPATRAHGAAFYATAGWKPTHHYQLLKRTLPLPAVTCPGVDITPHDGRDLTGELARLYGQNRPHHTAATAQATYERWTRDERFTYRNLWTATRDGALIGAALVYPLPHDAPGEPFEALLADLLIDRSDTDADALRCGLTTAALNAAQDAGAAVARCVAEPCMDPHHVLVRQLDFSIVDHLVIYTSP